MSTEELTSEELRRIRFCETWDSQYWADVAKLLRLYDSEMLSHQATRDISNIYIADIDAALARAEAAESLLKKHVPECIAYVSESSSRLSEATALLRRCGSVERDMPEFIDAVDAFLSATPAQPAEPDTEAPAVTVASLLHELAQCRAELEAVQETHVETYRILESARAERDTALARIATLTAELDRLQKHCSELNANWHADRKAARVAAERNLTAAVGSASDRGAEIATLRSQVTNLRGSLKDRDGVISALRAERDGPGGILDALATEKAARVAAEAAAMQVGDQWRVATSEYTTLRARVAELELTLKAANDETEWDECEADRAALRARVAELEATLRPLDEAQSLASLKLSVALAVAELEQTRWHPSGELGAWVNTQDGQNHGQVMAALEALR